MSDEPCIDGLPREIHDAIGDLLQHCDPLAEKRLRDAIKRHVAESVAAALANEPVRRAAVEVSTSRASLDGARAERDRITTGAHVDVAHLVDRSDTDFTAKAVNVGVAMEKYEAAIACLIVASATPGEDTIESLAREWAIYGLGKSHPAQETWLRDLIARRLPPEDCLGDDADLSRRTVAFIGRERARRAGEKGGE